MVQLNCKKVTWADQPPPSDVATVTSETPPAPTEADIADLTTAFQNTQMAGQDDWSEAGWIRWNRQFNGKEWAEWAAKGSKWSAREWEIYARDVPEEKWAKWQINGYDRARKSRSAQGPASGSSGSGGGSASTGGH